MSQQPPQQQPYGYQPSQPWGQPPKPPSSSSKIVLLVVLGVAGVAALCIVGLLAALLIPAVMAAREAAIRTQSMENLKQIGMALHSYHDTYNAFPAAYAPDADGKPRMSWRAALLPFVDQLPLWEQYDSSAPWDDARNSAVRQTQLPIYQRPHGDEVGTNRTSYVVVTSQNHLADPSNPMQTLFPGGRWMRMSDVLDGTTNTIAVVEIRNSNIEWAEPRDIDIDSLSTDPTAPNSIDLSGGAVVLFADASVRMLPPGMTLETLKPMLTRRGNEPVSY
jgi:hypothetical protein